MGEILNRFWENLAGRLSGPMNFRLVIQPTVAGILAIRAGLKDARGGRPFCGLPLQILPIGLSLCGTAGWMWGRSFSLQLFWIPFTSSWFIAACFCWSWLLLLRYWQLSPTF